MNIMLEAQHPFLCGMSYFFQTDVRLYFVMPHINGGDFYHLLSEQKRLPENDIKFYITQIVIGLGELHRHGIMHRDLKLENIMLC